MSSFPSSHTTQTTTTSTIPDDKRLYINSGILRTEHGYLKIAQIIVCLIAFICIMSAGYPYNSTNDANWISFVTVCGFLTSGILLFLYFINAVVFFTVIPWVFMEFAYTALWTFFSFVAGIVAAVSTTRYARGNAAYGASAFFLFVAMFIYGYSAFRLYLLHRQGVRLVIVTTETTMTTVSSSTTRVP